MTPAQERQAYEEKCNKLARELLPSIVLRFREAPLEFGALVRHARGLAEEVLRQEGQMPTGENQIAKALGFLRDPERIYENRVACAISTLTDRPYEEQDWRKWQYTGATTITQYMVQNKEDARWWASLQSVGDDGHTMVWREFTYAAHWDKREIAQDYADRYGNGCVVPVQIGIPKEQAP